MDEMEKYRDRLEHRRKTRRMKNDRRHYSPVIDTGPKMLDADFWIGIAMFVLIGIAMYFID